MQERTIFEHVIWERMPGSAHWEDGQEIGVSCCAEKSGREEGQYFGVQAE